ncbi:MAG TPA: efflux RND transporter periplasmic adaptor subunit [Pirellulales bacterium]|jgi:HlyD family secretion protein|nr:efflux RND transporter periplasmic adaptor subunit [Pirellulales bacterium]
MKTILTFVAIGAIALGGWLYYRNQEYSHSKLTYRTIAVKKADLMPTISTTGVLQPEEVIDVGAQVVGRIKNFGLDPTDPAKKLLIDFGSTVHEGTELAYIDDEVYQAQKDQAQAALDHANADLLQQQAKLDQSELDLKRSQSLVKLQTIPGSDRPIKGIADADYETSVMNEKTAKANVALSQATIAQAKASLKLATVNLDYTVIRSPVEGVIIDRRVNIGQTVVASLNAPSLFLIAKDLRRMQVWASVNEADLGRIKVGMPARFMVDAFPTEVFRGKVIQIRDNASMTQNVVTYTVIIETDNSNLRLRPYFTANLQFEVENKKGVLVVPTAALRWKPKPNQVAEEYREAFVAEKEAARKAESDAADPQPKKPLEGRSDLGRLWLAQGEFVRPIQVHEGVSDGVNTEVSGAEIKEGLEVVIGEAHNNGPGGDDTTNPFAPKFNFGKKKK